MKLVGDEVMIDSFVASIKSSQKQLRCMDWRDEACICARRSFASRASVRTKVEAFKDVIEGSGLECAFAFSRSA